jgi:hypothetical protein
MKRMVIACVAFGFGLGVLLAIGRSPHAQPTNPPVSRGGTTDPGFDWERPPNPREAANRNWIQMLLFKSTKTLEQTTAWLQWAIARYGHARGQIDVTDVTQVGFRRCTMQWSERQIMSGVTRKSKYSVPLEDVDLRLHVPQVSSDYVTVGLTRETAIARRYLENGRDKGSRTEHEASVNIPLQNDDQIPSRVAWALVHASCLCGARVKTEYGS